MTRTIERILGIIGMLTTFAWIAISFIIIFFIKMIQVDEATYAEFQAELLADPTMTPETFELTMQIMELAPQYMWIPVVLSGLSFLISLIALIQIWNNRNPKMAGILFIVAGFLCFGLSITSIIFYITAVLCFVRKAPKIVE